MPIRTTEALVEAIIEVESGVDLTPFIAAASALTNRVKKAAVANDLLEPEESGDPTRDEVLQQIETWLAAHFYAVFDARPTQEQAGSVATTYQSRVDLGLNVTHYGQQAIALDETGTLLATSEGRGRPPMTVGVHWVGTEDPCETTE